MTQKNGFKIFQKMENILDPIENSLDPFTNWHPDSFIGDIGFWSTVVAATFSTYEWISCCFNGTFSQET